MSISIQSNAKINLALYINYKRKDGYHDISTLIQEIDFSDEITISKNHNSTIQIYSKGIQTPTDSTNLCHIAAKAFLNSLKIKDGVDITINKRIPIGAGLGGGSSNAISTIKALMKIFEVEFIYDDYDKRDANAVGSRRNPFRVRMMYPRDKEYDAHYWSSNHRVIHKEFDKIHNPLINPDESDYQRKYCVQAIRRVR